MTIVINELLSLADDEIEVSAIRSQGKGGQNVNKVSTAIMLRFDIRQSSLPGYSKHKLLTQPDQRVSKDGILVIKAQERRTQEQNRIAAIERLQALIRESLIRPKRRIATRPTNASKRRRLDSKKQRGQLKSQRKSVDW